MATVEKPRTISPEETADMQEVCRLISQGKRVTDPELRKRIQARSDEVRRQMLQAHGITNIAVDLIREVRDEE